MKNYSPNFVYSKFSKIIKILLTIKTIVFKKYLINSKAAKSQTKNIPRHKINDTIFMNINKNIFKQKIKLITLNFKIILKVKTQTNKMTKTKVWFSKQSL